MNTIRKWALCFVLNCIALNVILAQDELCRGHYFTEEQGKSFLDSRNYASKADWSKRRDSIITQIKTGMEFKGKPDWKKSTIIRHSKKVLDGYSVENIAIESLPGIYITGNLYMPLASKKKYPVVLAPHGHASNPDGRYNEWTQTRSAMLARAGAIVLAYDMIGYGDSKQSEHKLPKALKLQTLNSMRVLDYLLSLPNVDKNKVAITGESGGGTQSFILTALDDRIKFVAPTVMVSAHFFGGCDCESGMPIHKKGAYQTNNVEIAALAAPRPMLLTSIGNDWTKNTPTVEFPFVQGIYRFYGLVGNVENVHLPTENHDYGPSKRKAMYAFMAKHLSLDFSKVMQNGAYDEGVVKMIPIEELKVFDTKNPLPSNYLKGDEAVNNLIDRY